MQLVRKARLDPQVLLVLLGYRVPKVLRVPQVRRVSMVQRDLKDPLVLMGLQDLLEPLVPQVQRDLKDPLAI